MSRKIHGYKPLPDYLTVKKSKLHGLGIFAIKKISAGQKLGITHIKNEKFPDGLIRTPLGGFINHSSKPNCIFIETEDGWKLETLSQIEADEELTADYVTYDEDILDTYN